MASFMNGLNSEDLADLNNSTNPNGILDMMGFDLMKDNILKQIYYDTESTIDYLDMLKTKFNHAVNAEEIDVEDRSDIKSEMIDFCESIISAMSNEFDLMVNLISDDYLSMLNVAETWYNFFVLNRYNTVERFLIHYIEQNKTPLISSIEVDDKIRDISSLSYKKLNYDKDDVVIMANITEIIEFIRHSDVIDNEEFLSVVDDGDYYTGKLIELYNDGVVYGNFVPRLLHTVLGEEYDNNEATRIRNSIRAHFYTKLNNVNESEE